MALSFHGELNQQANLMEIEIEVNNPKTNINKQKIMCKHKHSHVRLGFERYSSFFLSNSWFCFVFGLLIVCWFLKVSGALDGADSDGSVLSQRSETLDFCFDCPPLSWSNKYETSMRMFKVIDYILVIQTLLSHDWFLI